jgi:transposase
LEWWFLISLTAATRILVAVEPADFRRGIDGLSRAVREEFSEDPFSGSVFVFRNRRRTAIKILAYDGQGFWLCQKRLSQGRFRHWPTGNDDSMSPLEAHELTVLLRGGDPAGTRAAQTWRAVTHSEMGIVETGTPG